MTLHIAALCRFPVKALSPQPLEHAVLETGGGMQGDHVFALAHGAASRAAGGGDAVIGRLPRTSLITLSDCPKLATLRTRFIDQLNVMTVERGGRQVARGDLTQPVGRAMLEDFFGAFLKETARGGPRIVIAKPGETFANHETPGVVLINRASVADIERVAGKPVDPTRFRANVLIDGPQPWQELDWVGHTIRITAAGGQPSSISGGPRPVTLRVREAMPVHPAAEVNPETGEVDLNLDKAMKQGLGHDHFGVLCEVVDGGTVTTGDTVMVE
ncbi:MOSC domain protein [Caenispirillum salinarum AK4]|uniref:MOSC domain protein n=1 Tax=Caenispirillum salinarum AK4 TaxID=1238182 RepID=K9GXQ4_9PROT|nr:MOSC domain-containing protein [Caenispirillum salinarum]EKV30770.1 MOSC domain protein [Caenispirillum salinarum AK4]